MLSEEQIEEIREELTKLSMEEQQKKLREILAKLSPEEREQLVGKQSCPFCLMVEGKIPVKRVYEDGKVLAILDINPANKGHTLLFPKEHAQVLSQVHDSVVKELFVVANKISTAIFDGMKAQGTNIFVANGPVAGQTAPHVLIHIIPRFTKDGVAMAWEGKKVEEKEMDSALEAIRKKIPIDQPKIAIEKKLTPHKADQERIP